ncbi:protein artichoke [Dendroctonus ponderosae]|uniref:protein artichoke n=1 Tax=Dendroctonus ponderosae TaxID=77166 RepID=UPI002034FFEB|nr:protein artichoke [Dendroctonus ponderosae]
MRRSIHIQLSVIAGCRKMALIHAALIASALLGLYHQVQAEYIPPGPLYRCPKEKLLLHPCSCDVESDQGLWISCNNTNIASMSLALNNLATFELPIETLTIKSCHIARLFGSLLYKLKLRVLRIEETPLEIIDEFSFLGVNNTLNELHIVNSSLLELPLAAFKILGNITVLNIDGHNISDLPKEAFFESEMSGKLLKLHIVNGHLNTPPIEALQPLRKLKTLDLHGNRIKELKRNQFKGLRDVEILDLSFNMIPKIDSSHLADLTKMSWLNVSHNSLKELTRGAFARNTVLRVLNMSFNQIKKLDSNSFRGMRFLRRLFLSDNLIGDVGRGTFGSLQRIGTIDLARNLIKKVDYQMFFQLNFIELLDLSENQITEVQKLAFKDLYLSTINMAKNQISTIESGAFENCANVTKLDLSENQLRDIPKRAFDETTYATELQLAHNFFTSMEQIPLHNMTGLKILNVSHNQIETVPKKTFPKLYELHTIDLSYNNLSDIFNSVFTTLFSLRTLDLSHNSLEAIKPSTFGPLPTLLRLDMSFNRLETIAKSALTRLASTRELIVSHNKLSALFILPISTSHLDLSHNEFETIPPKLWPSMNSLLSLDLSFNRLGDSLEHGSFTNLLTLQKLNLSYNGLTRPPWTSISELTALQYLYVQGNNLTTLRRNAFGKVPVMFELDLSNNAINNVSTRAFEGLLQLIHLKMNNNNISVIPNGAFQGLVSLTDLDLSQNRLVKLDNKTNGIFDDCLSLERLNLSHNRITFITRKMFPSNPYIPYKLKQIDLSYNFIPVITYDLTFGTSKLEKLNMSHNAIADVRKGVIGNLTSAKLLDLSYNKLHDLTSDPDFFRLPPNISSLLLAGNELTELPWPHLKNVSHLKLVDLKDNLLDQIAQNASDLIMSGTEIAYEGNPVHCDCFLRPLLRHFTGQLQLSPTYEKITCASPPHLEGKQLYTLPEELLICPANVNTTRLLDKLDGDFSVLPDLRFREFNVRNHMLKLKWRVMKQNDIADTSVFIRDSKNPLDIVYQITLPYFKRTLEVDLKAIKSKDMPVKSYHVCLVSKTSRNGVRKFYPEQCRELDGSSATGDISKVNNCLLLLALIVYVSL